MLILEVLVGAIEGTALDETAVGGGIGGTHSFLKSGG